MLVLLAMAWGGEVLPVTRVRFYETGVAWFEREGMVTERASLPIPAGHLDDALKTLVVLGGDVDLGAVTFPSAVADEAVRGRAGLADDVAFGSALQALVGAPVRVQTDSRTLEGVLLDVSGPLPLPESAEVQTEHYALAVLSEDGSLERTTTHGLSSIRPRDEAVARRMDLAARSLSATRAQRSSAMDVQLTKGGRMGLGYLAEAPVWRVSYRVVEPEENASLIAWALIHNDTDEDWTGVQVELANGEPDSFVFPLAAPRYAHRELRVPDIDLEGAAQLDRITPDGMWTGESTSVGSARGMSGMGSGYGAGGGVAFGVGKASLVPTTLKTAAPVETPTQFVYEVTRPVDLAAHHSALVPLVQEGVSARAAVVFGPGGDARNGVWLANSTGRTLPEGVVSVLASGGLAGEARLERLKPEEAQMVTFGNELDLLLQRDEGPREVEDVELEYRGRQIRVRSVEQRSLEFQVSNRSGRERDVWVALELGPDEAFSGEQVIDPHTGWTYAIRTVQAGASDWVSRVRRPSLRSYAPEAVPIESLRTWEAAGLVAQQSVEAIVEARADVESRDTQLHGLAEERKAASTELDGLRATLAVTDADGVGPLSRRAVAVEGELRKLRENEERARVARERALEALHDACRGAFGVPLGG